MATRKPRSGSKGIKTGDAQANAMLLAQDANVTDVKSADLLKRLMLAYASAVNTDRAFVDWRDGLKPVSRRVLYALSKQTAKIKSAKVVGDALGDYHPHSGEAIYGALVTMVNSGTAPANGLGNWGTPTDGCAAMRYTEATMSEFGRSMFVGSYINRDVTPFVDNYDNTKKEPLVLPSLLPNVFFNGTSSIGVGLAARLPTFTPTSVLDVMVSVLDGQGFDPIRWAKTLKLFESWGGNLVRTRENMKAFVEFLKSPNGKGSLLFEMDHDVNEDNRTIVLRKFIPVGDTEKLIDKLRDLDIVRSVSQEGGKHTTVIRFVSGINAAQFDSAVSKVKKMITVRQAYSITVLDRVPIDVNNPQEVKNKMLADDDFVVNFHSVGVPKLMGMWLKWRIQLERDSLTWRIKQIDSKIDLLNLLIVAADNKPIIMKALDTSDPAAYLMKAFKWSLDQANTLLSRRIRQLSKADAGKFRDQLAQTLKVKTDLQRRLKNPKKEVRDFLANARDAFALEQTGMGMDVYRLKSKISSLIAGADASETTDAALSD